MKAPPNFPKELLTPIELRKPYPYSYAIFSDTDEEAKLAYSKACAEYRGGYDSECDSKLKLLASYYQLNHEHNVRDLLCRVLIDFVPGFRIREPVKSGRTQLWNPFSYLLLWHDVRHSILAGKRSVSESCNIIVKVSYWREWLYKDSSKQTQVELGGKGLQNRYIEACKSPIVCALLTHNPSELDALNRVPHVFRNSELILPCLSLPKHPLLAECIPETPKRS